MAPFVKVTGQESNYLVNITIIGHPANTGYPRLGAEVRQHESSRYADIHRRYQKLGAVPLWPEYA
jgi:hypothetical protein